MDSGRGLGGGVSPTPRETRVTVLELDTGEFFIAASLSTQQDTQLISIDPTTGALRYTGRPDLDVFPSEAEALSFATAGSYAVIKSMVHAKAILGYAVLGSMGLLLVATKLRASVRSLPGGDTVYTVVESHWVKISLRSPIAQPRFEVRNVADLVDILINEVHFFCETRDITRPFPSQQPVDAPDGEFVWNEWLSAPFKAIGLKQHCVVLLQGLAESRGFVEAGGEHVTVALTARRSRLHPGTRYLARGLNAASSTGNEIECEQLVWPSETTPGKATPYSSYLWRRGTVPIWWGAEIKSSVQEAEIYVVENQPLGASAYFKRLLLRYGDEGRKALCGEGPCRRGKGLAEALYGPQSSEGGRGGPFSSQGPSVTCVNLLRVGPGKPELVLSDSFYQEVGKVVSEGSLGGGELELMTYDWHAQAKLVGEPETVEGLWQVLKRPTEGVGFDQGEFWPAGVESTRAGGTQFKEGGSGAGSASGLGGESARGGLNGGPAELVPNLGANGGTFRVRARQYGVLRFNCADSLDRTNAASYFGAVQVLVEQCRRLGLSVEAEGRFGSPGSLASGRLGEGGSTGGGSFLGSAVPGEGVGGPEARGGGLGGLPPGVLPPGWEVRRDAGTGKTFYIDHNNRKTSWNHPNPPLPPTPPTGMGTSGGATAVDRAGEGAARTVRDEEARAWEHFDMTVRQFKEAVSPWALQGMADLFLLAGDVHATLYTGSKAMHAHVLQMFSEDAGKAKRASAAANVAITLQRRYLNMVKDGTRQKQLESFLGLRRQKYFPTVPDRPLQVHSRQYAFLLKPVPSRFPSLNPPGALLSAKSRNVIWVCQTGADIVQLYIYLAEPCQVAALLLTVAHGADEGSSPRSFDVRLGRHLDGLRLVLENALLPKCAQGVQLLYTLPLGVTPEERGSGTMSAEQTRYVEQGPFLYPFEEPEGQLDFLTRVVAITFYPAGTNATMTLGQVEVLGMSLLSDARRDVLAASTTPGKPPEPADSLAVTVPASASAANQTQASPSRTSPAPPEPASPIEDFIDLADWGLPRSITVNPTPQLPPLLPGFDDLAVSEPGVGTTAPSQPRSTPAGWESFGDASLSPVRAPAVNGHPLLAAAAPDWLSGKTVARGAAGEGGGEAGVGPKRERREVETYLRMVKRLGPPYKMPRFSEALQLEIARLLLGLSTSERNHVLMGEGREPYTLDPNRLLIRPDGVERRQMANYLAMTTRSIVEDIEMAELGFGLSQPGAGQAGTNSRSAGGEEEEEESMEGLNMDAETLEEALGLDRCLGKGCQVRRNVPLDGELGFQGGESEVARGGRRASASGGDRWGSAAHGTCVKCERAVCPACQAPPGSAVLATTGDLFQGPAAGAGGPSKGPPPLESVVCPECCGQSAREAALLDMARGLAARRRRRRLQVAADEALAELRRWGCWEAKGREGARRGGTGGGLGGVVLGGAGGGMLTGAANGNAPNQLVSLAEYPYAGLLFKVPTAEGAEAAESLLARDDAGSHDATWQAPIGATTAEAAIVLSTPGAVSKVVLQLGSRGYSPYSAPQVKVRVGTTCSDINRTDIGTWDLGEALRRAGANGNAAAPTELVYLFPKAAICRIVWLEFRQPTKIASRPSLHEAPSFTPPQNLLCPTRSASVSSNLGHSEPWISPPPALSWSRSSSLAPSSPSSPSPFPAAPSAPPLPVELLSADIGLVSKDGPVEDSGSSAYRSAPAGASIHARRIRVFGTRVSLEGEDLTGPQSSEKMEQKYVLDQAPRMGRMRVPVDAERALSGGRIVEQRLGQVPNVAGFRLDALPVARLAGAYVASPPQHVKPLRQTVEGRSFDEWLASPGCLLLRVSSREESWEECIDEFRLPTARAGTPLYFDFTKPRAAKILIFEIVGEMGPLVDEAWESSDQEGRDPLGGPLSLANKLRPYRYVPMAELGTWGQLNPA